MRVIITVVAGLSVGVFSQAFATDPPVSEVAKPPSKTTTTTAGADGTKTVRLIIADSAAEARLKRLRAAGYTPEAHGDEVVFCRREPVVGTHFQRKICNTAEQLESVADTGRDEVEQMQRDAMRGVPTGH